MDFDPDVDQQMIRDSAERFFADSCPRGETLKMAESAGTCPDALWQGMADLGWMGIAVPEEYGGLGLGFIELSMVLGEMGRVCLPGPYFASVVLGGFTLMLGGSDGQKRRWLPGIADGSRKATVALYEADGRYLPERCTTRAQRTAEGFALTGTKLFVLAADEADLIVCPATEDDGRTSLFVIEAGAPGLSRRRLPTLDITRPLGELVLDGVVVPHENRLGEPGSANAVLARVGDYASIALCAEMLGGLQHVRELTVEYVKQRVQFGKPIGSLQAIKHKCADLHMRTETVDAAARYAAWVADRALKGDDGALARTASVAKVFCQQGFYRSVSDAIQAHGGMGFTWEYELHLYLKRAKAVEVMFGDEAFHRERVIALGGSSHE